MVSFRKTYDSHAAVARLLPNQHQAVMRFARNCYLLRTCVEELINNNNDNTTTVRMDRCIQTQWQRFLFNQYYRRMKWFYDFGGGARRFNRCFFVNIYYGIVVTRFLSQKELFICSCHESWPKKKKSFYTSSGCCCCSFTCRFFFVM